MKKFGLVLLILLLASASFLFYAKSVEAAGLTSMSDFMTRQKAAVVSDHYFTFTTPSGVAAAGTIVVSMPTFTVAVLAATDIVFKDNGGAAITTATTGPTGTTWGLTNTSTSFTLTSATGTILAGHTVTINVINGKITNPAVSTPAITITAGADSGLIEASIITEDQIGISGIIDPTISFAISATTLDFGHFASAGTRWANTSTGASSEPAAGSTITFTVSTNATSGLNVSIKDVGNGTTPGLYSSGTSSLLTATAAANASWGTGTTDSYAYAIYGKNPGSNLTIAANFLSTATGVTGLAAPNATPPANYATFVSSTVPLAASTTVNLFAKAATVGTTKAGIYIDTLTCVCTGTF